MQLMDFIMNLFRRSQTYTKPSKSTEGKVQRKRSEQRTDDDLYLNTLEDQILKSLNIKRENNETYDSKGKSSSNKTPQARVGRKL
jgi:hypothetical protein